MLLYVVFCFAFGFVQSVEQPLPREFTHHGDVLAGGVGVNRNQVIQLLIDKVKKGGGGDDVDGVVKELQDAATGLMTQNKVNRLMAAVKKLNLTNDEVKQISRELQTKDTEGAEKVRRALEDAAVVSGPRFQGVFFPPGPFRGGPNPFYTVPLDSPAIDIDLDKLMSEASRTLGVTVAFKLTKLLHDQSAPRSEVFDLQEKFQGNITKQEAEEIVKKYEGRIDSSGSEILKNTAQLSGLNSTESHRFARAVEGLGGALNSSQAAQIHDTVQTHALNKSELVQLTDHIEKLSNSEVQSTTPDSAVGAEWIFSNGSSRAERNLVIDSKGKMFSSVRACGFAVVTEHHGVVFPWVVTLSCVNVVCTGTLVSNSVVVTSASCILACGNEALTLVLGDNRIGKPFAAHAVQAVVHPKFKSEQNSAYDIGLVKFAPVVDFNTCPSVFPICLVGVETTDPAIVCEVVLSGHQIQQTQNQQQPIVTSPVHCFQPGNQVCQGNSINPIGCIQPTDCNIPVATQLSSSVICGRKVTGTSCESQRYYLWGVTIKDTTGNNCVHSVARASDSIDFLIKGM